MKQLKEVQLEYNKALARLSGWTKIVELGGSLLGEPKEGLPSCRGQALIPDWTGNWLHCGKLIESVSTFQMSSFQLQTFRDGVLHEVKETIPNGELQRLFIVHYYISAISSNFLPTLTIVC